MPELPGQQTLDQLAFDEQDCICPPEPGHEPGHHDDRFGCTYADPVTGEPCPCTAGWSFARPGKETGPPNANPGEGVARPWRAG